MKLIVKLLVFPLQKCHHQLEWIAHEYVQHLQETSLWQFQWALMKGREYSVTSASALNRIAENRTNWRRLAAKASITVPQWPPNSQGMTWHDMTWHDMTWHDMTVIVCRYRNSELILVKAEKFIRTTYAHHSASSELWMISQTQILCHSPVIDTSKCCKTRKLWKLSLHLRLKGGSNLRREKVDTCGHE